MADLSKRVDDPPIAPTWLRIVGLIAFAVCLSVFMFWPMLTAYPHTQAHDGGFIHEMMEAARVAIVRWHELPLWNPYQCGGVPLWDNPQGMGAAPLYWPILALTDTTRAIQLWYTLHAAAGFLSMYVFARREVGLSRAASIVASGMWAFCGAHMRHICGGGFNWVPFYFFPLLVFLWRRAERDMRMAVAFGAVMALQIWGGGAYPVSFMSLILACETLTRVWPVQRIAPIAKAGAVAIVVAFCLSAGRLIPVIYQLRSHTRDISDVDSLQWSTLTRMFLSPPDGRNAPGQQYVWGEYTDYLGPFLLAISLLGILLGSIENVWLLVILLFAFSLMLGQRYAWAPWTIFHGHVPPFKAMRVPSRFHVLFTSSLAAFAGVAVDRVTTWTKRISGSQRIADGARTVILALAFIGMGDMMAMSIHSEPQYFTAGKQDETLTPSPSFYLEGQGLADFLDQPQQNRGRLACWEEWAFELGAALWTGDAPQARAKDGTKARVENVSRTQNTFTFDVDASEPTRVLLNSGWDQGWRTSVGVVVKQDHLLTVDVPAGKSHVRVKYWPLGLTFGLWLTGLGAAGSIAFLVLDARRRRRARAAAA